MIIHYSTLIMVLAYIFIQNQFFFPNQQVLQAALRAGGCHSQFSMQKWAEFQTQGAAKGDFP